VVKPAHALRVGLGFLALVSASPAGAADAGALVLSGGITATIKLTPATCIAGPGASMTVNDVTGGGWDSLSLYAIDPAPGGHGTAELDVNGSGFTKAPYAVDDWIWKARKKGHISAPLTVSTSGTSGSIDVVVPVSDTFQGPSPKRIRVKLSWHAGICKPYTTP
jgi:hypothetical protein